MPYAPPIHRPPRLETEKLHEPALERQNDHGEWYANRRWRKFRAWFLSRAPLCARCKERGETTLATEVHHVIPRLTRPDLAYSADNLEGLCKSCHSREEKR